MLEEILDRRNIEKALVQVESNKGAAGIDAMGWNELRPYINTQWQSLRQSILEGRYEPKPVRKVEIPKPQGGKRMLGIPTVIDRMLQQAVAQWLMPKYEEGFSNGSYGFRPKRNAHQAVLQAQQYLNAGKALVIEMDLQNFFDKVNHDRLLSMLSRKIPDKNTLKFIRSYLTSGIMEGGVISTRSEGTPQGSPLSPILSNIVLDELDKELEKRKHTFVRYADDISLYVSSEASANRVMTSVTKFIEQKLLLKVNREKTKISKPEESVLLGFSFRTYKGKWIIRVAKKSVERIKLKFKEITKRNAPLSEEERIIKLNTIIKGWVNYFVIAKAKVLMQHLDGNVRTRLRMCKWKQWKNVKTRRRNLLKLGASFKSAYLWGRSSKGYCRVAQTYILGQTLTVAHYKRQGYVGFYDIYYLRTEKQTSLF
ncbi:MAG TPA: group II intron reverse transcriptase/maturase [Puia sp.]|jgi:group II intron reverse transcriptase/maturase